MASEELSLNWNDHHKTLVAVFEKLLEQSTLVDCTIAAEGQYVKAHKVILSACSPYFELLFSQENEKNPIIILKDIKFRELKAMIDFVYRGSVKIPQDRLQDFVDAAESLQIKGLGVDQKKNNPGKRTNNFENDNRKKDEFLSQPKKRVKSSSSNKSEENSPYVPPEGVKVSKNIMSGSRSFHQIERSVAKTSSSFTHSVSDTPAFVNVGQESRSSTEENFPCSTEQQSDLETVSQSGLSVSEPPEFVNVGQESHSSMEEKVPCPTEQPVVFTEAASMFAESGDVKTEPESKCVPEVIVPDRLLEPKKEECEEEITILDSEEEADESLDADGIHDGNSQHLSSFPPTQESILGTSDSYALEQMDHSNTQGSQWSCTDENQFASSSWPSGSAAGASSSIPFSPMDGVSLEDNHSNLSTDSLPTSESGADAKRVSLVCQVCGLVLRAPCHMAIHMRTHTGERPFKCQQCDREFSHRNALERHQLLHAGSKPYKCEVCEKSFGRLDNLKVHQRIHTGDRPYRCGVCDRTFNRSSHLQKHHLIHARRYLKGPGNEGDSFHMN